MITRISSLLILICISFSTSSTGNEQERKLIQPEKTNSEEFLSLVKFAYQKYTSRQSSLGDKRGAWQYVWHFLQTHENFIPNDEHMFYLTNAMRKRTPLEHLDDSYKLSLKRIDDAKAAAEKLHFEKIKKEHLIEFQKQVETLKAQQEMENQQELASGQPHIQQMLHNAIMNNSAEEVRKAFNLGAFINCGIDGKASLLWAVLLKRSNAVEELLKCGANTNIIYLDQPLVEHSIKLDDWESACLLAKYGAYCFGFENKVKLARLKSRGFAL